LTGDDCLRQVGSVLKEFIKRGGELVARYGGEEFIIILSSTMLPEAVRVGEIVRKKIESLQIAHPMSEVSAYVTVSVGVATVIPQKDMMPSSLLKKADHALYQAKKNGRNRVEGV